MKPRAQGTTVLQRVITLALFVAAAAAAADPPLTPLTVCEITADLAAHEGKDIAVLGRYSFRREGRWIGEDTCDPAAKITPMLWLTEDSNTGPKPPGDFELDVPTLNKKFADLVRRTSLG